ncbi:hypothetical protein HPY24_11255, partial [Methylobacterium sp. IIF1SW-B5]|nr:hypothetical protein [Methylobacterium ajmalii]
GPIQRHLAPAPVSRAKHYSHKAAFTERLPSELLRQSEHLGAEAARFLATVRAA